MAPCSDQLWWTLIVDEVSCACDTRFHGGGERCQLVHNKDRKGNDYNAPLTIFFVRREVRCSLRALFAKLHFYPMKRGG